MTLTGRVKDVVLPRMSAGLHRALPHVAPGLMQVAQFWPHEYKARSFSRPTVAANAITGPAAGAPLPVPPPEFWAHYCTTVESFLESGREDVEAMRAILAEHGMRLEAAERLLDLGCAGGRMTRWMADLTAGGTDVWGTDIWSSAVLWCQDHLSPPCHFATTTMAPHLPFEDRSFDIVCCGSLFTHIDDLAETWFLELHRILRPGGRLYFSVNDRHALRILEGNGDPEQYPRFYERTGGKAAWDRFVELMRSEPDYRRFRDGSAYMMTVGRSMRAHVMWDSEVLAQRLSHGFKLNAITPASYGHQSTVLLERV